MKIRSRLNAVFFAALVVAACQKEVVSVKAPEEHIRNQMARLAPVVLTYDCSRLPDNEVQVIKLLVKASQHIDEAFLIQVGEKNQAIRDALNASENPVDAIFKAYFDIMFGPWDRLDEDRPFIDKAKKPLGANFYPADMDKESFVNRLKAHPEDRPAFESNFTMIRRVNGMLTAIPYSRFFQSQITEIVALLNEAAALTADPTLRAYLKSRAKGFETDDYYQSDMDWMDLAGDIEVVIGPYEVYEDGLFGYKAAFESFVCVVDHEESNRQKEMAAYTQKLEAQLPIAEEYKNFERGSSSPIKIVHLLYSAGDTKAGIQTTAFNLPNDERVREAKGSKKVMLKNVMRAKFDNCWIPIVNTVLDAETLERVSFDGYFYHVLLHEISHGLGPGKIVINGQETTVNRELKELYSVIEECKADVIGIYLIDFLADEGVLPRSLPNTIYASHLGGMFRSIRFGIEAAHGGGVAIQLNYCLDHGGCGVTADGKFRVDDAKMRKAVKSLARELLMIQAEGDYEAAKAFVEKYRVLRPEVAHALDRLKEVPIDIRPVYPIENEL